MVNMVNSVCSLPQIFNSIRVDKSLGKEPQIEEEGRKDWSPENQRKQESQTKNGQRTGKLPTAKAGIKVLTRGSW